MFFCRFTHLLENGTDLRNIQVLPGHASSKTTEIDTHLSKHYLGKIESPLDQMREIERLRKVQLEKLKGTFTKLFC